MVSESKQCVVSFIQCLRASLRNCCRFVNIIGTVWSSRILPFFLTSTGIVWVPRIFWVPRIIFWVPSIVLLLVHSKELTVV
eukprot:1367911-Amorphochlora_amoeboformis.AAC.1